MIPQPTPAMLETPSSRGRVHVVGAGPWASSSRRCSSRPGLSVQLYEKRNEYKRTRMVKLSSYLVADSLESYRTDHIDGENVEAVFDPAELDEGLAFRQSIPSDLMSLLQRLVATALFRSTQ